MKKKSSPAAIGALCAIAAAFSPFFSPLFFFVFSLPLLIAAFVLAIVAIAQGRSASGIALMIGVFLAAPFAIVAMTSGSMIRAQSAAIHRKIEKRELPTDSSAANERLRVEASPTPVEARLPREVALVQPILIEHSSGQIVLQPGTRLRVVSVNGDKIRLRYLDTDYEIPISQTDFK